VVLAAADETHEQGGLLGLRQGREPFRERGAIGGLDRGASSCRGFEQIPIEPDELHERFERSAERAEPGRAGRLGVAIIELTVLCREEPGKVEGAKVPAGQVRPKWNQRRKARAEIDATDKLIRALDAVREAGGLTKAQLARRIEAKPESIWRLFTAPDSNPTMEAGSRSPPRSATTSSWWRTAGAPAARARGWRASPPIARILPMSNAVRKELHELVDALPPGEEQAARRYLEYLRDASDPYAPLDRAEMFGDLNDAERARLHGALRQAEDEIAAGKSVAAADVLRELRARK
jgi:hypothetical protein